ncbi:hypothetical protein PoB_003442100 [Plakobranchus ocellatus]|uniref:Uncharacterized protein n=1 Tax=Plakobranchus ocellatus TaxID=259542 RepID=A0AAV4A9Q3_9GAST|nr:hypothetical protein PoB_003442100 [Plakobranchus ocellatus]
MLVRVNSRHGRFKGFGGEVERVEEGGVAGAVAEDDEDEYMTVQVIMLEMGSAQHKVISGFETIMTQRDPCRFLGRLTIHCAIASPGMLMKNKDWSSNGQVVVKPQPLLQATPLEPQYAQNVLTILNK